MTIPIRFDKAYFRFFFRATATAFCIAAAIGMSSSATADYVVAGSLTMNLDGNAFANGADIPYISTFGVTYNPAQTFMEFAGHNSSALPGRPLPSPANFDDVRDGWVRPDSSNLMYDFNPETSVQTFVFDPSYVASAGGTGSTRFLGGTSFWYANQPLMYQGSFSSIWIQYGNLDLSYYASRAVGGNSGWVFANNVLGPLPIFDTRNVTVTATANSLAISGDLFTAQEFRDGFAILPGLDVGSFTFTAVTAVPEPSSFVLGTMSVLGLCLRRMREN